MAIDRLLGSYYENKFQKYAREAYTQGLRDPNAIASFAAKKVVLDTRADFGETQFQGIMTGILAGMFRSDISSLAYDEAVLRGEQLDFLTDMDSLVTIKRGKKKGGSVVTSIGDLTAELFGELLAQKQKNKDAVVRAYDKLVEVGMAVLPLLADNPGWLWRDAAAYINRSSDGS